MVAKANEIASAQERLAKRVHTEDVPKRMPIEQGLSQLSRRRSFKRRAGKELWGFLRPRLLLMVKMQKQWGDLHDVYGEHKVNLFEATQIPPMIRDPDSKFSEKWDMIQIMFLFYTAYTVPMRTGFDLVVTNWTFEFFLDLFTDIYFTCDLFLSFRTAYWDHRTGVLVVDNWHIASNYMKGWFLIDLVSTFPLNYIMVRPPIPTSHPPPAQSRRMRRLRLV